MNAVAIAIVIMFIMSLSRFSIVLTLVVSAIIGGLLGGLSLTDTIQAFNSGLGSGAKIALSYATLGAFALALSKSGLPDLLTYKLIRLMGKEASQKQATTVKYILFVILLGASVASQNIIPVHIAFIPVLIPPLLTVMNRLQLDRRAAACVLTLGLIGTYMLLPVGFGAMFLEEILMAKINEAGAQYGLVIEPYMLPIGMAIPVAGMVLGMLIAVFFSYRKPRQYHTVAQDHYVTMASTNESNQFSAPQVSTKVLILSVTAVLATLAIQLYTDSMILGGLVGFAILSTAGIFKWQQADDVFVQGMRMMALVGFIMISAAGFASVMEKTGEVTSLVTSITHVIGDQPALAAFFMLLVGLLVTLGIGSSFSTVPILTIIYVPLCVQYGFSPLATVAIIGTAAALGDAGSPASDSTLGPTSGLNIDGQHDHMWDTVVPTFIHFNIPLLIFGWIAAMVL